MSKPLRFEFQKMHSLGNDFVVLDLTRNLPLEQELLHSAGLVQLLCDRRFGIGCDQIMALSQDQEIRIWNQDGSMAEICGNGMRAVERAFGFGRYKTASGEIRTRQLPGDWIEVSMNVESVDLRPIGITLPSWQGEGYRVGVGNPHFVIPVGPGTFLQRTEAWAEVSSQLEHHREFGAERTNVEWVCVDRPGMARVLVWERGTGLTLACGSGGTAVAAWWMESAQARGEVLNEVSIQMPGGEMAVRRDSENVYWNRAPVAEVYRGEWLGGASEIRTWQAFLTDFSDPLESVD